MVRQADLMAVRVGQQARIVLDADAGGNLAWHGEGYL